MRAPADLILCLIPDRAARLAPEAVTEALDALKALAPRHKPLFLKELLAAAYADGSLRIDEAELLRLVSAVLGCPLPPLLDAPT